MRKRVSLIAVILSAPIIMSGCLPQLCTEKLVEESRSPDQRYTAAILLQNCGATTPFIYHVNLRPSMDSFSANSMGAVIEGQVFVARRKNIKLTWEDYKTLSIECFGCQGDEYATSSRSCIRSWKDVSITCKIHED
jgi:hypothetical protein